MSYITYKTKDKYYKFYIDDIIEISEVYNDPIYSYFYILLEKKIQGTNSFGYEKILIMLESEDDKTGYDNMIEEYEKLMEFYGN